MSLRRLNDLIEYGDIIRFPLSLDKNIEKILYNSKPILQAGLGACNIKESESEFEFEFQAPGFTREELQIDLEKNVLKVQGEHKQEEIDAQKKYHRREVFQSSFMRRFSLPENVDTSKIDAILQNGILQVRVLKLAEKKLESKSIKISKL